MANNQQVPGCVTLGQIESLLQNLEMHIGSSQQCISAEQYWATLAEFALSVPLVPNQAELSEEERDSVLSRVLGFDKETFLARVNAKLRQRAKETAAAEAAKNRLRKR
jgi:hypothetical protein